ncbi:Peptidase C19 ubiquitin carboxyl-terminal hydrolase [Arabidopsis thaliana x Arabidopsis arenosa]|uniref:Peptidase C19 ubiquitin carboxyl-terminal hydrolase n=1 Tax=Arabidopsis thaliana x Arabidopsis arenosa TaxID=1240361 RepID=A0A8T2BGI2_9BRAS|nr:Peptidase C19 ubiquitin carboxyl-terminal hydrolase [Arabidopsis thaliana x Arabidopsis arenosa]
MNLLNDLVKLSVFDYRFYILHLMKRFLQEEFGGTVDVDAKAKLDIVQAELLSEETKENETKSGSLKMRNLVLRCTLVISLICHLLDLINKPTDDLLSEAATRYRSALDMTLKFFNSIQSSVAAKVLVVILEFCHFWKSPERESLVTRLFTLEVYERMSCRKCRSKPNYLEQSSYGIVVAADSIRDLKCALGNIEFEDILKVIRMKDKMLCDIKTGGCGKDNFVHHTISRCPPIFTIMLEWEKNETEKEISETTMALYGEIDISRLYKGLDELNTKYRFVSMIGCGEERNYNCLVYKKNRWVHFRHETLAEEVVGDWKSVVRFCGERNVRPEILFNESF